MIEIPRFAPLRITQRMGRPRRADFDSSEHVLVVMPRTRSASPGAVPLRARIEQLGRIAHRERHEHASTRLENTKATTLTVALAPRDRSSFARLTWARRLATLASERGGRVAVLVVGCDDDRYMELTEALLSALAAASFRLTSFKTKQTTRRLRAAVVLGTQLPAAAAAINAEATGNNLARWLTALPPNVLDAAGYRAVIEKIAAEHGFEFEFFSERELEKLGAGAFLAVAQGNGTRDAGIVRLGYTPQDDSAAGDTTDGDTTEGTAAGKHRDLLALVGKGIVFDTGGNNLKPFRSMLNMHMDMQGSAVALGLLVTLSMLRAPCRIETWLAITENRVSARAYKSQDVVTAANGTTIQVIHTDAEGRMVLADTLALAARSKPDLMIDFATLTGTCVTALTSRYSGVFTNRCELHAAIVAAGRSSGERVWPFPMDDDFDEALESSTADIKQCAEDSAGDHILAARFLARFVPKDLPWLHVDLSAARHKGGLAHIPTEFTGFGVRFAARLLQHELALREGLSGLRAS